MPTLHLRTTVALAALAAASGPLAASGTGSEAYRAMKIDVQSVLSGTVTQSTVVAGSRKQVVAVVTYLTGSQDKADAVNVRLAVLERSGGTLTPIYERDFGAEQGGFVGDGELQLVDLDLDGSNEIIVSWESYADPLVDQRVGEVIAEERGAFVSRWTGPLRYDATRAARTVPLERRDRFEREVDVVNTVRTRGATLFFRKRVIAVAGERLAEPQLVEETFSLGAAPR